MMRLERRFGLRCALAISACACAPVFAVTAQDSSLAAIRHSSLYYAGRVLTAPATGLFSVTRFADNGARHLSHHRSGFGNALATIGNQFGEKKLFIPVLGAALLAGQVSGNQGVTNTAWAATKAVAVTSLLTHVIKMGVGRGRPDSSDGNPGSFSPFTARANNHSFPSGHTAAAFALATSLALRTDNRMAQAAMMTGAALTGFARITYDRHWLTDVLVGAAAGYAVARLMDNGSSNRSGGTPGVGFGMKVSF